MKALLFFLLALPLVLSGQSLEKARRLAADGNHREAADLLTPLVLSPKTDAKTTADALSLLAKSLDALDALDEAEKVLETAARNHPADHRVLYQAAQMLEGLLSMGQLIGGEFVRSRGGDIEPEVRDRVRCLQLLTAAWRVSDAATPQMKADILWALCQTLAGGGKMAPAEMVELTEINTLPDHHREDYHHYPPSNSYPCDAAGNPIFFAIPASWDAAKNDGERIRWLLDQFGRLAPGNGPVAGAVWAQWTFESLRASVLNASDDELRSLADDETILSMPAGAKRLRLPADHAFIPLFRAFLRASDDDRVLPEGLKINQLQDNAKLALRDELPARRQRPALVSEMREWLKTASKDEAKWLREDIGQLTGAYGRFLGHPPQIAGQKAVLELIFRNATKVGFTARRIDVAAILAETEKRFSSRELDEIGDLEQLPRDSVIHTRSIGTRILLKGGDQFLSKPVAEWRMDLQPAAHHEERTVKVNSPVSEAGAYWIEATFPGGYKTRSVLWIESIALVTTSTQTGRCYFLADAITGSAVEGAELRLFGYDYDYEKKKQVVRRHSVKTGKDGTVIVPWSKLEDYTWLASVQMEDGRETHLGFEDLREPGGEDPQERSRLFIITDRPVYRPGQKVSWHAWARRVGYDPKLKTNAYADREYRVSLIGPRDDTLNEQKLTTDEHGGLHGSITLAPHAALGDYSIKIQFAGRRPLDETLRFRVEEYKKPEFAVKIDSPAAPVLQGEDIEFTVRADYYFGGAVTNAKVKYTVAREGAGEVWQPASAWDWLYRQKPATHAYSSRQEIESAGEGHIDANGMLKVRVPTLKRDQNYRYTLHAEVTDASRRVIAGDGMAIVVTRPFEVGIDTDRGWYPTGTVAQISVRAHSAAGTPVKAKGRLSVLLGKKRISEFTVDLPDSSAFDLPLPQSGLYELELALQDEKGREVKTTQTLTAHGNDAETTAAGFSGLKIEVEKKEYQPGEEVRMLIHTEKPGGTVVLFLRGEPVVLKVPQHTLEHCFELLATDQPNLPWSACSLRDGRKHQSSGEILLPPTRHIAKVELIPDSTLHGPRDKGRVRIVTRDGSGQPLATRVVLTGYDKSLEYISGGSNIGDIRKHFWGWRNATVGSFMDTLRDLEARVLLDEDRHKEQWLGAVNEYQGWNHGLEFLSYPLHAAPPAPAMSGAAPAEAEVALMIRNRFADSVVWRQDLATGSDGTAEVDFPFPDNLTTWKLKAWVLGPQAQVGEAEVEVITRKDLLVRLQAPRFFIEKDEVLLSAIVHNDHANAQTVETTLELENGTLEPLKPLSPQTATLPPHSEKRLEWRVRAQTAGEARIRVSSRAEAGTDAMELTFPVHVRGAERVESQSACLAAGDTAQILRFEVPQARREASTRYQLRYTPSLVPLVLEALPPLIEFPHECAEQTLNRFVPAVVAVDLLKQLKLTHAEYTPAKAAKLARTGLERLRDMRHEDGGWGWFPGAREPSAHMTALIVRGLQLARYAGQSGTDELIAAGIDWLKDHEEDELRRLALPKKDRRHKSAPDDTDALVHAALSTEGQADPDMRERLYENHGTLSRQMVALLGMVCHNAKETQRRDMCLRNLKQYVQQDEATQTACLKLPADDRWGWQNDPIETQATFLRLLLAASPADPLAPRVVKYLVQNRRHTTHWNSTRDTAAVIHALSQYLRSSPESSPDMDIEFVLDGKTHSRVHLDAQNLLAREHVLTLNAKELPTGAHKLEVRKASPAPLYASASLTVFSQEETIPAAGLDIHTQRRFFKIENDMRMEIASDTALRSGDLLEVQLILESTNDAEYLLVEDFKPAGFETVSVRSGWSWDRLPSYREFRDEKVCFYIERLHRGRHTLSYLVRAETPGRFTALPTQVSAMYAPDLRANSTDWRARVKD